MNGTAQHRLVPKLWETLPSYTRQRFVADLIAGVTVGLVALPLAMAFAISSGVAPEAGIYTAIIAGFVVSALGGSRCQIAGPTGAFVVIVAGIVAKFGVSGLLMCTAMAGVMLHRDGPHGPGHGRAIHSALGDDRLHQRHRRADRLDADQRFLRPGCESRAERVPAADGRPGAGPPLRSAARQL